MNVYVYPADLFGYAFRGCLHSPRSYCPISRLSIAADACVGLCLLSRSELLCDDSCLVYAHTECSIFVLYCVSIVYCGSNKQGRGLRLPAPHDKSVGAGTAYGFGILAIARPPPSLVELTQETAGLPFCTLCDYECEITCKKCPVKYKLCN